MSAIDLRQRQFLETIEAAVEFVKQDRDYLVGGLLGFGTQQVATAIDKVLADLLSSLDYIEARLHQSLRVPIGNAKRELQLACYSARAGDMEAVARDLDIARSNFLIACDRYETHAFLRVLCLCTVGVLRSLQGNRYGMTCSFQEAFGELEAFRFLKISATLARLEAANRDDRFLRADLERQAAAKVDAIEIPEWGVTISELRATLQAARASAKANAVGPLDSAVTAAEFGFESFSVFGTSN